MYCLNYNTVPPKDFYIDAPEAEPLEICDTEAKVDTDLMFYKILVKLPISMGVPTEKKNLLSDAHI